MRLTPTSSTNLCPLPPALLLACLLGSCASSQQVAMQKLSASVVHPPNFTTPCDKTPSLDELMQRQFNRALTTISVSLFHDQRGPEERLDQLAQASAALLGCLDQLWSHRTEMVPEVAPADEHAELGFYVTQLKISTIALQLSALEQDESAAHHWFQHVKQACSTCHARYRVDTEAAEEASPVTVE